MTFLKQIKNYWISGLAAVATALDLSLWTMWLPPQRPQSNKWKREKMGLNKVQLLAPQSGALRISAYRDFHPILPTYSFWAFKPFNGDLKQPKQTKADQCRPSQTKAAQGNPDYSRPSPRRTYRPERPKGAKYEVKRLASKADYSRPSPRHTIADQGRL